MSYLEKFQATDVWRNKFKKLLLTERKPQFVPAVTTPISQRLSFELSEDLQVILEEKKIPRRSQRMPRVRDAEDNKENVKEHVHFTTSTKLKHSQQADATLVEDASDVLQITNTSFDTLERMCEKTASDPDSTLFRYLDRGSTTMMETTRAGRVQSYDEEAEALQRLLDELNVEETEKRLKAQASLNGTQLEDIEAPSRFWENTFTAETLQSISPVKMVGLLRQSTIMEECSDVSESDVSSTTYQSALKTSCSSETTGCYDTANETAAGSEQGATKKISINSSGASSSTSLELFQQRPSRHKFFSDEKEADSLEKSLQLIDLETTVMKSSSEEEYLDSLERTDELIPVATDSPDSPQPAESSKSIAESTGEDEDSLASPTKSDGSSSVIELSDDESTGCSNILKKIEQLEAASSVLNRSFTVKSEESEEEKSLHFNDTMEEVEYMMKKGMEYMQAAKEEPLPAKSHLTPIKKAERYRSPSPMLSSPLTPKTVIAKPKPVNKFALDMKPIPKMELFKKPQGNGIRAPTVQNKFVSSLKKPQYAHVISPIGAYIHKTPTTPLVSTIKPGCSNSGTSKAFKQLQYDSRVMPQGAASAAPEPEERDQVCSLPKKAYISSEYKQIVDERTQITIPGGPKIQRYLLSSMIPAVVRHEGKVKIPLNLRTSDMEPPAPRRTEDSLADLSMISGDVSVYTIKDAQKF